MDNPTHGAALVDVTGETCATVGVGFAELGAVAFGGGCDVQAATQPITTAISPVAIDSFMRPVLIPACTPRHPRVSIAL
jgi:hypothetical protein